MTPMVQWRRVFAPMLDSKKVVIALCVDGAFALYDDYRDRLALILQDLCKWWGYSASGITFEGFFGQAGDF